MHWNPEQILWALLLAAHLVLLIVLLGRDRIARFPWFTAAIGLDTVRLLADHLLNGKLTNIAFYWQSYSSMVLDEIIGVCVLVEISCRVVSSGRAGRILKARGWAGWALITVAVALTVVGLWGEWPSWVALTQDRSRLPFYLVILTGIKGQLFLAVLTIQVFLLLRVFGARFGFGWTTHPQQIALGLSTNAIALLSIDGIREYMRRHVHANSFEESAQAADHLRQVAIHLERARNTIWLLVVIWWIVWLWRDDPTAPAAVDAELEPVPVMHLSAAEPLPDREDL